MKKEKIMAICRQFGRSGECLQRALDELILYHPFNMKKEKKNHKKSLPNKLTIKIHKAEEGGFWAEIKELPNCYTQADTFKELLGMVGDAILTHKQLDNLITIKDDGKKKTSEILNDCRKLFKVWSFYSDKDLDKMFPPVKSEHKYKYVQEADENLKNLSANDLKEKGLKGISLRERLLFELEYFKREGRHLDIENVTLCSGSHYSLDCVPSVRWLPCSRRVDVDCYYPDYASSGLRAREKF